MSAVRKLINVEITTRQVAERLYDQGFLPETLPRREEDLALAILKAFEGQGVRFGDLPARKADFHQVRKHLGMIVQEVQRYERSLEADRYRPAFVIPVGRM